MRVPSQNNDCRDIVVFRSASFVRPLPNLTATTSPEILQGDIVELKIPGGGLTAVEGRLGKTTIPFYSCGSDYYGPHRRRSGSQARLSNSHAQGYDEDGDAARHSNFIANQDEVVQKGIVLGGRRI